jgi:hypothetical protein
MWLYAAPTPCQSVVKANEPLEIAAILFGSANWPRCGAAISLSQRSGHGLSLRRRHGRSTSSRLETDPVLRRKVIPFRFRVLAGSSFDPRAFGAPLQSLVRCIPQGARSNASDTNKDKDQIKGCAVTGSSTITRSLKRFRHLTPFFVRRFSGIVALEPNARCWHGSSAPARLEMGARFGS